MSKLRCSASTACVAMLAIVLVLSAPVAAQDASSSLENAIKLFEEGEYQRAQEALVGVNPAKLSEDDKVVRSDYLTRVQVAITMHERALRDLEDAETAISDEAPDHARRMLQRVVANEYAAAAVRRAAADHLRILESRAGNAKATSGAPGGGPADQPNRNTPTRDQAQRAKALTEEGDTAVLGSRYDEAIRLYERALEAVAGYPEAVTGLQRVREHQQTLGGDRGQSLIERIRRENQINWQRVITEFHDLETNIRNQVSSAQYDPAHQLLIRARQVVESGKQYADPATKFESLFDELELLETFVVDAEREYNETQVAKIRSEIEEQRRRQLQEVEKRRQRQVDALMSQAMQHRKDGDFEAAINVLRQVIAIDPKNQPARWTMDMLVDLREYQIGRELRDDFYRESQRALNDVERSKIPWHDETQRYPDNWLELISRPERRRAGSRGPNRRLFGALDRKIPADFVNDPFDQVIERLATTQRINLIVNWNDLKRAGVERDVPIDLNLPREISLKKVLTETLEQAGGGLVELGFEVHEGVIKIATRATLSLNTYTAVYDINDLLMEIPIFTDAPLADLNAIRRRSAVIRQADRPWRYGDDDDDEPEEDPGRRSRVRKMIDLIQDTVDPDSWIDRGGRVGSIREINGQLVVTQNSSGQRQVANILGKLREQRAIQIAVEARFITVSSHYLEELGIDIDIVLNAGNAGFDFIDGGPSGPLTDPVLGTALLLPRTFSRLGFTPLVANPGAAPLLGQANLPGPFGNVALVPQRTGGGGSLATPVPILNQISGFTSPTSMGSDVPGSFAGQTIGPAFSLFGSFLDNIQVDFLIRATQADSRTSVLTAPRLVLFNGQRSWVAVTIQRNFVSQLNPVVATGAVAQQPVTATVDSGAVLDVAATVTADRRYVTMTLRPGVTRLIDLLTIPFSGGGAGGGFGGGTALAAFIQLPTLSSQRVQTTVSIPDGGTLLIGGQKLASETEVEAGVPILSKIPILKRIYQSRTMVKDEQTLLILVKPTILIQAEQEEIAFPSFEGG